MKVLLCGPTTESVEAILQSYREARNPASSGGGSYALWTDQYAKTGTIEALMESKERKKHFVQYWL